MTNNTRNSFDRAKNRSTVVFQQGTVVVDSDLNEAQDILRSAQTDAFRAMLGRESQNSSGAALGQSKLFATGDAWKPVLDGANVVLSVSGGVSYVDGFRLLLAGDLPMGDSIFAPLATPLGPISYGVLYATITLAEITDLEDPTIAIAELGITALRREPTVVFAASEAATLAAAIAAVPALGNPSDATLLGGFQTQVLLCRFARRNLGPAIGDPGGPDVVQFLYTVDLREPLGEGNSFVSMFSTGSILWDSNAGKLYMSATAALDARGPQHLVSNPVVTYATPGVAPSGGWTLPVGKALGWRGLSDETFHRKGAAGLYFGPSGGSFSGLTAENLYVGDPSEFTGAGAQIVCRHENGKLLWANGHVTYDAPDLGSVADAINRDREAIVNSGTQLYDALRFLVRSHGLGNLALHTGSNGGRKLRFSLLPGDHAVAAGGIFGSALQVPKLGPDTFEAALLHTYVDGATYPDEGQSLLEFVGYGKHQTRVTVPKSFPDGNAVLVLSADTIVLKGIAFDFLGGADGIAYGLKLVAQHVIIEDCEFAFPVDIVASNITLKRTRLWSKYSQEAGSSSSFGNEGDNYLHACCLRVSRYWDGAFVGSMAGTSSVSGLTPFKAAEGNPQHFSFTNQLTIEDCVFTPRHFEDAHGALVIGKSFAGVAIRNCTLSGELYGSPGDLRCFLPMIVNANDGVGYGGRTLIEECRIGYNGTFIAGRAVSGTGSTSDTAGRPFFVKGGSPGYAVTCSAIAFLANRTYENVTIRNNSFSIASPDALTSYSAQVAGTHFWAAAAVLIESSYVKNLLLDGNSLRLPQNSVNGYFNSSYGRWIGGFIVNTIDAQPDFEAVTMRRTRIAGDFVWAGIIPRAPGVTPAKPAMAEAAHLLAVKNTYRGNFTIVGVELSDNVISMSGNAGGASPVSLTGGTVSPNYEYYLGFYPVSLDGGDVVTNAPDYVGGADGGANIIAASPDGGFDGLSNAFTGLRMANNVFKFRADSVDEPIVNGDYVGVILQGLRQFQVYGNFIELPRSAGASDNAAIRHNRCIFGMFACNVLVAKYGLPANSDTHAYSVGNVLHATGATDAGGIRLDDLKWYSDGAGGFLSNFTKVYP
jgi:hypothetical protein